MQRAQGSALTAAAMIGLSGIAAAQSSAPLSGSEIVAAFAGKLLEYRNYRRPVGDPNAPRGWELRPDGGYTIITLVCRDDGSLRQYCRNFTRLGQPGTACLTAVRGGDVGLWRTEGEKLCVKWTMIRGGAEVCFRVYREGAGYRFVQASGPPSSADGQLVEAKVPTR